MYADYLTLLVLTLDEQGTDEPGWRPDPLHDSVCQNVSIKRREDDTQPGREDGGR